LANSTFAGVIILAARFFLGNIKNVPMESTSSGSYKDYPPSSGRRSSKLSTTGPSTQAGGKGGGKRITPQANQCRESLMSVKLEEVARCHYYLKGKTVPAVGVRVRVRDRLFDGRIAVETVDSSVVVGFLPTIYNYIRRCLAEGFSYEGEVVDSALAPLPAVSADLKSSK
jgi:hypothetical protein